MRVSIFLCILVLVSIIPFVNAIEDKESILNGTSNQLSEVYTFDEPADNYWKVKQHLNTWYACPEENSVSEIKNKIDGLSLMKDEVSDEQILKFKEDCDNSGFFLITGVEAEEEIKQCFDYLFNLLSENNLSAHNIWLHKECYVRAYFKERFNPETLDNYDDSYFRNRLSERDNEFIDFIRYKYQYGSLGEVSEEESVGQEQAYENVSQQVNRSEDVEIATASYENERIPENIVKVIKENLKNFLKWFS